jgi:hypothetical protein
MLKGISESNAVTGVTTTVDTPTLYQRVPIVKRFVRGDFVAVEKIKTHPDKKGKI